MFSERILYLGNNTTDTDERVTTLATKFLTVNHGIVADEEFVPSAAGLYHVSVTDLSSGSIIKIANHFNKLVLLDQPVEHWTHPKLLWTSIRLLQDLEVAGHQVEYKDNDNVKSYLLFDDLLKNNKSFCIYPWINYAPEGKDLKLCARSAKIVTTSDKLSNWQTDKNYNEIRQKMLDGVRLEDECRVCYLYESKNAESYRIFETKEWVNRLNINSIEDLNNISNPYYYEIRLSNKCNAMCRGCVPHYSHLIKKEFKTFNIVSPVGATPSYKYTDIDVINIDSLTEKHRVYLTGGEPTIMSSVTDFMQRCIDKGRTNFEITLGTNGEKLTPKFLRLIEHFKMQFSVSLDGYGKVNDYWRWGTHWENVIENTKTLESLGHQISINCVPGIYNVTNLYLLYEFLDREFPNTTVYSQLNYHRHNNAYNHPNAKMVVESMERCKQTKMYYSNGKSNKTVIDSLHDHYSKDPGFNLDDLKSFFDFNDQLDSARGVKLGDYIPELEECRKYLSK